jgi:hypothetical protein
MLCPAYSQQMGSAHAHEHHQPPQRTSIFVQRRLAVATVPFLIATIGGLVLMWPGKSNVSGDASAGGGRQFAATVIEVESAPCGEIAQGDAFRCYQVNARLEDGPDAGEELTFPYAGGKRSRVLKDGDGILLAHSPGTAGGGAPAGMIVVKRTSPDASDIWHPRKNLRPEVPSRTSSE